MALSADLLRGYTDTIILNQLREGDNYGYEINKRITDLSGGRLELKEATLYTAFRRMENSGYIISYWGDENTGARRRYYSITTAGRDRLDEDLSLWKETQYTLNALLNQTRKAPTMRDSRGGEIPVIHVEE